MICCVQTVRVISTLYSRGLSSVTAAEPPMVHVVAQRTNVLFLPLKHLPSQYLSHAPASVARVRPQIPTFETNAVLRRRLYMKVQVSYTLLNIQIALALDVI